MFRNILNRLTGTLQNYFPVLFTGSRSFSVLSQPIQFLFRPITDYFRSPDPLLAIGTRRFVRGIVQISPMDLQGRILVYSILGCPHCMRAKSTLQELNLPYTDVRLDIYPKSVREYVQQRTGRSTVPQIFFNATHIGGNDDLQKLVRMFMMIFL